MMPYTGLIMVMTSWLAGGWLLTKWWDKDLQTISRHAASTRFTIGLFAVVLIGFGTVFYGWMYMWVKPALGLGWLFGLVLALTFACQILTAVLPDVDGWKRTGHKLAAWTMAGLMLVLSVFICVAPNLDSFVRLICTLMTSYMIIGAVLVMLRLVTSRFLFYQVSYVMASHLVVLAAAYL